MGSEAYMWSVRSVWGDEVYEEMRITRGVGSYAIA